MLSLDVTGLNDVSGRFDAMPASIQALLLAKADQLASKLQAHVVQDKLGGQVLNRRSGALANSIQASVVQDDAGVSVTVASVGDLKYAAIQEYGGRTAPHDILPDKGEALAFMVGGKQVFARIVHHPGSTIPERSYLRSALADMADEITAGLNQAVMDGLAGGVA